jgi:hypothetical protein
VFGADVVSEEMHTELYSPRNLMRRSREDAAAIARDSSVRVRSIGNGASQPLRLTNDDLRARSTSGMQWTFDRRGVLPAPPALETLVDLNELNAFYENR